VIKLENVTLLGVDCVDLDRLVRAADVSSLGIEFGQVKLLSDKESNDPRVVGIDPITEKKDYDKFIIEKLNDYVTTDYVLLIQWDGFVLNPKAWDDEYLKYDFIGAPWPNGEIGNGGFSLRSKKLLEECAILAKENELEYGGDVKNQEDVIICHTYKIYLESRGITFAPVSLAKKFSIEGNNENKRLWTHQLGFHDFKQTNIQLFVAPNPDFNFTTFYKYSDKGAPPPIDKKTIFLNFVESFSSQNVCVLADNSEEDSVDFLKSYCLDELWETNLGNAEAHVFLLDKAKELPEDHIVYFCEDDYVHIAGAKFLLAEGLDKEKNGDTLADYTTLYDHADKYVNNGPNPAVKNGGEETRVVLGRNSHWKYTDSTTMTFAAKVKTIKEDYDVLKKYCTTHAKDGKTNSFEMFKELREKKGRKVASSLPARSTHLCPAGMESPYFPWQRILNVEKLDS
jgi:hypothetical protein